MIARRYALLLIALGALLLVSCVVSLGFGPARVPVVSARVRPDSCSNLVNRRSPFTPTSHNGISLAIGSLVLILCAAFTSSSSPGATRSPSPRANAPSNWSLALGMILG